RRLARHDPRGARAVHPARGDRPPRISRPARLPRLSAAIGAPRRPPPGERARLPRPAARAVPRHGDRMTAAPVRRPAVLHEVPDTGETVLCNVDGGRLLVLNDVGVAVWHLVDGCRTVDAIAEMIAEATGADATKVRADVEAFLDELAE